jgi:undecaprenyl-diphosphatase
LRQGHAVRIDVGEVAGNLFLNTASLGSYPEFVAIRERREDRLGKPVAAALAVLSVWRRHEPLDAVVDGVPRRLLLLFVGNGRYEPRGFVPRFRRRLDTGCLDVRLVDSGKRGVWGLLAAALTSDLYRSSSYVETTTEALTVRLTGGANGQLARDGEVEPAPTKVSFAVRRQALTVFCGRHGEG